MSHPGPARATGTLSPSVEMTDRHDTTARLLESPAADDPSVDHSRASVESDRTHPRQPFLGHENDSVPAVESDSGSVEKDNTTSGAVLWKGLPLSAVVWEVVGVVLSICFLVLGVCVALLEGKTESAWSTRVVQATRIAPSIWPIVFSGILGSALRALADWKVERGSSLLALEQLLGSLTMAGTIITIFRWSILRAGSFALILLWAFNPLGSQASFRGAYLWSNLGESQGFITYHNPNVSIQAHLSPFGFVGVARSTIRALFSSAMYDPIASTQYVDPTRNATRDIVNMLGGDSSTAIYGAMDSWNNVRIPSLEDHPNYSASDTHRWLVNAWLEKRTNYSSLIGDRVLGINRSFVGNTSFTMSSSYQKYNCIPWINLNTTTSIFDNGTTLNDSIADVWLEERTKWNLPQHTQGGNRKWFLWLDWDVFTRTPADPPLLFASRNTREDNLAVTECKARTTYIDVNVTCISKGSIGKSNCGVDAMRESQNPPASSSKTPLNEVSKGDLAMGEFMEMLNDPTYSSSSHLEYYLADPLTANQKGNYGRDQARLGDVDIRLFERRWSLVWNTFWKTAWSYGSTMGAELTLSTTVQTFDNTTSFVTYPLPPVYTIDRPWLATYFIAVSIMLAAAVFALVMRALCRAPVLLGYVSSLTRDSVFFTDADHKSTTEDGPQRSKRLGKMCVMVADVGGGGSKEGVGRIAFAPAEMGRGRRVEKGRWYD